MHRKTWRAGRIETEKEKERTRGGKPERGCGLGGACWVLLACLRRWDAQLDIEDKGLVRLESRHACLRQLVERQDLLLRMKFWKRAWLDSALSSTLQPTPALTGLPGPLLFPSLFVPQTRTCF